MGIKHLTLFLLKSILRNLKSVFNNYKVYKIHGLILTNGTIIKKPNSIHIGNDFSFGPNCEIYCQDPQNGSSIIIGNKVSLNSNVTINADCGGKIDIGDNVIIGPMTILRASNHNFSSTKIPIREQGHTPGKIVLKNNVWIGANVVILPNVVIGESAIIGAGSVVTKSVAPSTIYGGNPARLIRNRNHEAN